MINIQLRHYSPICWALLLGVSLTLSFAPFGAFPVAFLAPIGLLLLMNNQSPKQAFWLGWSVGVGLFCSGVYWIYHSMHFMGDLPSIAAAAITISLAFFMGLFPASACYFTNRYFPTTNLAKTAYAFPAIWVISEIARSWLFTGFPWLILGYSQTHSPLKGYAPLFGVYGVSLFTLMTGGLLLQALLSWRHKQYRQLILGCLSLAIIWIAGSAINTIKWTLPTGHPIAVSLVQGNIPQSIKWSPEHLQESLDTYETLTEPLLKKDQLIIWPESAVPMTLQDAQGFINYMSEKAHHAQAHLILGLPIEAGNNTYYNAVISLGPNQHPDSSIYIKRHLVPFGEYTPLSKWLNPVLNYFQIPTSNLVEDNKQERSLLKVNDVTLITSICFEVAFPELVNPGMNGKDNSVLLTVTNDAWFGRSIAQAQHLQIAEMRSIELNRPGLFVGNDGITAIITAQGKVIKALPAYEAGVLNGSIQPMTGLTPWMSYGSNPLTLFIIILLISGRRIKNKIANPTQTQVTS